MRGKGTSWTRTELGCVVKFYGWASPVERMQAWRCANEVRERVWCIEPRVDVRIEDADDGVRLHVIVRSEDLACFHMGPMHTQTLARCRGAASQAMRELPSCQQWSGSRV